MNGLAERVARFIRAFCELDRGLEPASFDLAVVHEAQPGRGHRDRERGGGTLRWQRPGKPRLVVILEEADRSTLVVARGRQVVAYLGRAGVDEMIVERLV